MSIATLSKAERHNTAAETRYWCSERKNKQMAKLLTECLEKSCRVHPDLAQRVQQALAKRA